jgi:hypothetical protein
VRTRRPKSHLALDGHPHHPSSSSSPMSKRNLGFQWKQAFETRTRRAMKLPAERRTLGQANPVRSPSRMLQHRFLKRVHDEWSIQQQI